MTKQNDLKINHVVEKESPNQTHDSKGVASAAGGEYSSPEVIKFLAEYKTRYDREVWRARSKGANDPENVVSKAILKATKLDASGKPFNQVFYNRVGWDALTAYDKGTRETQLPEVQSENITITEETGATVLIELERMEFIRSLLFQLGSDDQFILELFLFQEWPQKRIAKFLDTPHGTVRSQVSRAYQKLLLILGENAEVAAELFPEFAQQIGWLKWKVEYFHRPSAHPKGNEHPAWKPAF